MSSASIASQTKLPPSPELKGLGMAYRVDPHELFSLSASDGAPSTRLCAVAQYGYLKPTTLVCAGDTGALAGANEIALFRLNQHLHVPTMMLRHGNVSALALQSSTLASASRGKGVLVWDVSGHTPSPLQGRLGLGNEDGSITSLEWMAHQQKQTKGTLSLLAASTRSSACLWDVRQYNVVRPTFRFGISKSTSYLQIACSASRECALLDTSGIVRVFDVRMLAGTSRGEASLCQFEACKYAAVGISCLPSDDPNDSSCSWVTWGLDSPDVEAVVKIWKSSKTSLSSPSPVKDDGQLSVAGSTVSEGSYTLDGSPALKNKDSSGHASIYQLVGQCSRPHLACARVCPSPAEKLIVTVGLDATKSEPSWNATLWEVNLTDSSQPPMTQVTSFNGSNDDIATNLRSVLGQPKVESLRAAELGFSTFASRIRHAPDESKSGGLILCCLSENGYVTTHAIPEVSPPDIPSRKEKRVGSTTGLQQVSALVQRTKQFPSEWESKLGDAAAQWGKKSDALPSAGNSAEAYRESVSFGGKHSSDTAILPPLEGGSLDAEKPITFVSKTAAFSGIQSAALTDLASPVNATVALSSDDVDRLECNVQNAVALMESIQTDRIPCPRLCGATFSPGVGGFVAFHNGDVKRMWQWWGKSDPARIAADLRRIGEASTPSAGDGEFDSEFMSPNPRNGACPRTFKDLVDMTTAAKEAQWGELDESEASSTGFPALGSHFFDDDSGTSSDSGDELGDEPSEAQHPSDQIPQMYNSYFSEAQRPLNKPLDDRIDLTEISQRQGTVYDGVFSSTIVGPTSEILTPVVRISREFDKVAQNGQKFELAQRWEIGDFTVKNVYANDLGTSEESPSSSSANLGAVFALADSSPRRVLPSYRSLLPVVRSTTTDVTSKSCEEDEKGVHGGEYTVRVNMQESMVFLKKLFMHQQHGGSNSSFPSHLTPPDSPMLPRIQRSVWRPPSEVCPPMRSSLSHHSVAREKKVRIGVYTLLSSKLPRDSDLFKKAAKLCSQNAGVCHELGDDREVSWLLIEKIVRSKMRRKGPKFDGWGGRPGGALGTGLLENLLRYYESRGDMQMLSTIVCVLRGPILNPTDCEGAPSILLPKDEDARYDTYIRRYAELLYGWGLLTKRAEFNKHLSSTHAFPKSSSAKEMDQIDPDQLCFSDIPLACTCPRCSGPSDTDGNYCRSCQDFVFRCCLCDNAVRGLFTVCGICRHGGHVNHIEEWFTKNSHCPSGCGCICRQAGMAVPTHASLRDAGERTE